jgi:hypothetical protein
LQASIIGQIWKRSLTRTDALIRETSDLDMQAFDPARFRELIGNQRVQTIIREAFPDNPDIIPNLEKMALSAFETSNFTQGGKTLAAVDPANAVNLTGWAFLGRISALGAANRTNLVNQLWAGAAGSQFGKRIGLRVTAGRVKDIMIDAALYPAKGAELGLRVGQQTNGFWATLGQTALDVVTIPPRRPGASLSIIERGTEELEELEELDEPAGPPPRRMAADMKLRPRCGLRCLVRPAERAKHQRPRGRPVRSKHQRPRGRICLAKTTRSSGPVSATAVT